MFDQVFSHGIIQSCLLHFDKIWWRTNWRRQPAAVWLAATLYEESNQEALLSQRGHAMLRVASIQNVERSLLLLVVSASDILLRTIKFFSVLFSSAYWSMLQAVTNKHSLVRRRLCDLHCIVVGNCFWHFARPAIFDSQLLDQNRDLCLYPTCIRRPL